MATKFYLPSGAGSNLPTITGSTPSWDNTGAAESAQRMKTTRQSTTMTTTDSKYADATSGFRTHLIKRFISDPLAAQTISGDVQLQLRCQESSTIVNATLAIAVYRINSSGAYQDTLLSVSYSDSSTSPYEMVSGTLTNRRAHDSAEDYTIALTSRTFSEGDMLVVEVGFAENYSTTSRYVKFSFGDDSDTDLGDNTTDTSAYNPWVNFSQTITFATVTEALAGTADAAVTVTGEMTRLVLLQASIDGGGIQSSVTGELTRLVNLQGAIGASSPNILSENQASGTDTSQNTTGFGDFNSTISSSTAEYHSGSRSLKAATLNQSYSGAKIVNVSIPSKVTKYFPSIWIKGPNISKYLFIQIWANSSGQIAYGQAYPTGNWQRLYCTEQSDTSLSDTQFDVVIGWLETPGATYDLYIDDAMVEESTTLHDWSLPGAGTASSVTGELTKTSQVIEALAGTITASATAVADKISSTRKIAGTSDIHTTSVAEKVSLTRKIAGTSDIHSTSVAEKVSLTRKLAVAINPSASTVTGELTESITEFLAGTSSASATTAGALARTRKIAGTSDAVATVVGELSEKTYLAGTSDAVATTAGALARTRKIASTSDAVLVTSSALTKYRQLAGTSTPSSTVAGEITEVKAATLLEGTSSASATTAGALSRTRKMAVTADAVATTAGFIKVTKPMATTIGSSSTTASWLTRGPGLSGVAHNQTTVTGALASTKKLAIVSGGAATTASALSRTRKIAGTSDGVASTSADISTGAGFGGTIQASSTTSGVLKVSKPMAVGIISESSVSGQLSSANPLAGTSSSTLTTSGHLSVSKPIAGTVTAGSTATSNLYNREEFRKNWFMANVANGTDTYGDTNGFFDYGGTSSSTTEEHYMGSRCLKVAVNNAANGGVGISYNSLVGKPQLGQQYVVQGRIKAEPGHDLQLKLYDYANWTAITNFTSDGTWQEITVTGFTNDSQGRLNTYITTKAGASPQTVDIFIDKLQFEIGSSATKWRPGSYLTYNQETVEVDTTGLSKYSDPDNTSTLTRDTSVYYEGSASAKLLATGDETSLVINISRTNLPPVTPEKLYRWRVKGRGVVSNPSTSRLRGYITWRTSAGTYISSSMTVYQNPNGDWQTFDVSGVAPATAGTIDVDLREYNGVINGDAIWWDDAWFGEQYIETLAGTATAQSNVTGSMSVAKKLAGTSDGVATVTGDLIERTYLAGTSSIQSVVTGALTEFTFLAGTSSIQSTSTSVLTKYRSLAGTSSPSATVAGVIKATKKFQTTVEIQSNVSGTLTPIRPGTYLVGSVGIQSTTASLLSVRKVISGVASASATAQSVVTRIRSFGGFIINVCSAGANLIVQFSLAGDVDSYLTAAAHSSVVRSYLGEIGAYSTAVASKLSSFFGYKSLHLTYTIKENGVIPLVKTPGANPGIHTTYVRGNVR